MFTTTLNQFAQATDNVVTVPVSEVDTSGVETAASVFAITSGILFILGLINLVMFIVAIVHLVQNPNVPNRVLWIILSIFIPFAAWIYVLGPRRSFNRTGASVSQNPFPQQTPGFSQPQASPTPFQQAAPPQQPVAPQPTPQPFTAQPQQPATPVTPPTIEQPFVAPQPQPSAEPVAFAPEQPANSAAAPQSFDQEAPQQPSQNQQV